jgi:hypothetical protein
VDMRTGSPDPDSPFRALPAAGDSETEILDIEQPPNMTAARVRPAKSRPRPDRFHAAARPGPAQSKTFAFASGSEVAYCSMCVVRSRSPAQTLTRGRSMGVDFRRLKGRASELPLIPRFAPVLHKECS